ncbi:hypothetical protein DRQ26_00155 [bacterium]|nr:MAG: hypothetical protein DRQ26_00155 [bacterium]
MENDIHRERFLVFDLEMTGLSPDNDSIIEIGAVPLYGMEPEGEMFFSPMRPYTIIGADSKRIHGLDGNQILDAPPPDVVLPEFFNMMKGKILVGQNPSLDLSFLWKAAKNIGGDIPHDWAIDISKIFSFVFPQNHLSLDAMAKTLKIRTHRENHNALEDAIITSKIFIRLVQLITKRGIYSTRKVISIGKASLEYK